MRSGRISWMALCLAAAVLAACSQQKMVYLLADGRVATNDPVLSRQLEADKAICNGEMARSVQGGDHGDGSLTRGVEVEAVGDTCMTEKGYIEVRQDQVAATQQELAASAAAQARSTAPPPPSMAPPARN